MKNLFKFPDYLVETEDFLVKVADKWNNSERNGKPMYALWTKLQLLKPVIKTMHRRYSNIYEQAGVALEEAQQKLAKIDIRGSYLRRKHNVD